jgi:hypothetical protein
LLVWHSDSVAGKSYETIPQQIISRNFRVIRLSDNKTTIITHHLALSLLIWGTPIMTIKETNVKSQRSLDAFEPWKNPLVLRQEPALPWCF